MWSRELEWREDDERPLSFSLSLRWRRLRSSSESSESDETVADRRRREEDLCLEREDDLRPDGEEAL